VPSGSTTRGVDSHATIGARSHGHSHPCPNRRIVNEIQRREDRRSDGRLLAKESGGTTLARRQSRRRPAVPREARVVPSPDKEDEMVRFAYSLLALASLVTMIAVQATPVAGQSKTKVTTAGVVNINTASAAELEALPGVGPKTAALIVEYRQKNGPFKKIEDVMNVRGLGEKNFLKLKEQLTVGAPKSADRAQQ
jgi:competence protein ComEA